MSVEDVVREVIRAPLRYGLMVLAVLAVGTSFAFLATPRYRVDVTVIPSLANDGEGGTGRADEPARRARRARRPGDAGSGEQIRSDRVPRVQGPGRQVHHRAGPAASDLQQEMGREEQALERVGRSADAWRRCARLTKKIRGVSEDRRTGVVTVSITWPDRAQATQWANGLVARANQELRERTIAEAKRSLSYLEAEVETTVQVPVREGLYRLMESQLKIVMMANARHDYAFKIIDPARNPEPEDFAFPKRLLTIVGSLIAGCILAAVVALLRAARSG